MGQTFAKQMTSSDGSHENDRQVVKSKAWSTDSNVNMYVVLNMQKRDRL